MNISIVLTIIADDQPGVIQAVSRTLHNHGGSWNQSSMSSLAGQFAGILLASVPRENSEACQKELHGLESEGLRIIAHIAGEETETESSHDYLLELVGNDRPGIVHDLTTLLSDHNVNVLSLETVTEGASMGGGELFRASIELAIPASVDIDVLQDDIEEMANDLMVDISFEK
jgi:glycine cleavage system regulatory protein